MEKEKIILETKRLYLREMQQTDFNSLCKILKDPEAMYAYEHAFSDEEVQEWLDRQRKRYQDYGFGLWAVIEKASGEMIGQCGLTMQDCDGREVLEVGYLFQRAFWHKGFATEAAIACKEYAFEYLIAEEVYSIIRDNNLPSQNVAMRNGMAICGKFVKHYYGIDMPHLVFCVKRIGDNTRQMVSSMKELCERIHLQDEIFDSVIEFDSQFQYDVIQASMNKLFYRETWNEGVDEIKRTLGDDPKGIKMLACMLKCAMQTYEKYLGLGMEEQILVDTMKCFTRFIGEHKVSYGTYAFDREWWTARQISGNLFRIGELEYELVNEKGKKYVSLHIPSDAKLITKKLSDSYRGAKLFFGAFFPDYQWVSMICESWLLSPALQKVLPATSNILAFQKAFVIERVNYEAEDVFEWVFKNPNIPLKDLPEETSLQQNLKKYLLDGGKVGVAFGRLMEPAFQ